MLDVRTSDKGAVYLYNNTVLMTYVVSKREVKIPAAKIVIFSDSDICQLFLRDVFIFTDKKDWSQLVSRITQIGSEHEFYYTLGNGFIDSSVKMNEKEMDNW